MTMVPVMADDAIRRGLRIAIAILGVVALALIAGTAWLLFRPGGIPSPQAAQVTIGGPFTLTSQTGAAMSDRDLAGRPFAVFFGFTHCPEVCPTTLWEMSEALKALGADGDELKMLFISVDPTRDTPSALAAYLQSFDPRIVGLTGTEEQVAEVGNAYRAYWKKIPTEGGDYTMDHTASVYLMDGTGRFVGTIAYGEQQSTRMEKLRRLVAGSST